MKYYLHSVDTMDDEKVSELFKVYGYEGTGLFHAILEKLAKQEKPIKTDILKYQLKVGKRLEKCWSFMESLGIISSNNGDTFNKQLMNYAQSYQIKKEKTAKKISEWRENQKNKENVTSYENICNPPKVKESKVKESKGSNILLDGEKSPSVYPQFISIYNDFILKVNNTPAKIDTVQGSFAKKIISYLEKATRNTNQNAGVDEVLKSWSIILGNYEKWDFYQGKLRLQDIYTNIENIINLIKNGKFNNKAGKQSGVTNDEIDRIAEFVFNRNIEV